MLKKIYTKKRVLVISGPTGVGESTITNEIIKRYSMFTRLITATTREPRLNEKNGKDYYFFSKEKFFNEIKNGNIIEYAHIKKRDVYYGSYKQNLEDVLKKGYNIIVNPNIVGAKYYKKNFNAITIFIKPDSFTNLKKRQLARNPNISESELKKRLDNAKYETENEAFFYDYIVVNKQNQLKKTVDKIEYIIKKEKYSLKI